jgi:hypothetical protein
MKNILNRLINHEILSAEEKNVLVNISNGSYNEQIASFSNRLYDAQHKY